MEDMIIGAVGALAPFTHEKLRDMGVDIGQAVQAKVVLTTNGLDDVALAAAKVFAQALIDGLNTPPAPAAAAVAA